MWKKLSVVFFFIVVSIPGIQTATRIFIDAPVVENRALAPVPDFNENIFTVLRDSNKWFADHFGFRSFLIRVKSQVDYSVFATSDRVYFGGDGQLFYRSVLDDAKPSTDEFLLKNSEVILANMQLFMRSLRSHGIQPIVAVNLLGDRIYPELVPEDAGQQVSPERIDRFIDRLSQMPEATFIDVTGMLRSLKPKRRVFHKTDFHWNDAAGFPVAQKIVEASARFEGKPSPWNHPLEIEIAHAGGGISNFLPIFYPPEEDMLMVKHNWTDPAGTQTTATEGAFEALTVNPARPGLLRPLVITGDSYSDSFFRAGMYQYFASQQRMRWNTGVKMSQVAEAMDVDTGHFLIQFIETSMNTYWDFYDTADIAKAIEILDRRLGKGTM
ncbi:MAG: alginate O-acetyltransferase AlgX-related protein [Allorhizobium sp.]